MEQHIGKSVIGEVSTAIENAYQTLMYELGLVKTGGAKIAPPSDCRKRTHRKVNIKNNAH